MERKRVKQIGIKKPAADVMPINQMETTTVQNLFNISQGYAKLKQQHAEYTMIVKGLTDRRTQLQKGAIALPVLMPLTRNKFYYCNDKVEVLKEIDTELKVMQDALKGIEGQLLQNRDAFIEAGLAVHDWAQNRFSHYKPKNTYSAGCCPNKDEVVLFEGEMDDILKNKKTKQEFDAAIKKAKESNEK